MHSTLPHPLVCRDATLMNEQKEVNKLNFLLEWSYVH